MRSLPKAVRIQLGLWLFSGAVLMFFLIGTDPLRLPLPVLLLPFAVFALWVRSGVLAGGLLLGQKSKASRKLRVIAGSLAAVFLLVLTLQSLGQLSWRDLLLVGGLIAGLVFYFYKTDLF